MSVNVHFSSASDNWSTPKEVYNTLNREFKFDFDPCPFNNKWKGDVLFSDDIDGLNCEWGQSNFVNPPYSDMKNWCKKAYYEYLKGKTIVMLIPSRTDTSYWHDYIMKATEIRFIRGRLKFGESKNSAPFPSAIIIYDHNTSAN